MCVSAEPAEERFLQWKKTLQNHQEQYIVFVAEEEGDIIGFIMGGRNREKIPGYSGELYSMYLSQQSQRKGVGKQLFTHLTNWLITHEMSSMITWVAKENEAKHFYTSMGGKLLSFNKVEQVGGHPVEHSALGWKELNPEG